MKLFVLDTETTGLRGEPWDHIVDIGVVRVDTVRREVMPVYNEVVHYDIDAWTADQVNAWVFTNTDLCLDDVRSASLSPKDVQADLDMLAQITDFPWTAYNIDFDFGKFLNRPPWDFVPRLYEDIMHMAARYVPGDHVFDDGSTSYPKLDKAYRKLCHEDPAGIKTQTHRALDDAIQAAYVLLAILDLEEESVDDYDE